MAYENLDNAAEAALFMLGETQSQKLEHLGALYQSGDAIARTGTVNGGDNNTHGSLQVPKGSLLALFHNHPAIKSGLTKVDGGEDFSPDDRRQAQMLHVPSYISTPSGATKRFDPSNGKTEDVLGEFPIEEFKSFLMQRLLNRAPDDPRGLRL